MTNQEGMSLFHGLQKLKDGTALKGPALQKVLKGIRLLKTEVGEYAAAQDSLLEEYGDAVVRYVSLEKLPDIEPTETSVEGGKARYIYDMHESEAEKRELEAQPTGRYTIPIASYKAYDAAKRELDETEMNVELPRLTSAELDQIEFPAGMPDEMELVMADPDEPSYKDVPA